MIAPGCMYVSVCMCVYSLCLWMIVLFSVWFISYISSPFCVKELALSVVSWCWSTCCFLIGPLSPAQWFVSEMSTICSHCECLFTMLCYCFECCGPVRRRGLTSRSRPLVGITGTPLKVTPTLVPSASCSNSMWPPIPTHSHCQAFPSWWTEISLKSWGKMNFTTFHCLYQVVW